MFSCWQRVRVNFSAICLSRLIPFYISPSTQKSHCLAFIVAIYHLQIVTIYWDIPIFITIYNNISQFYYLYLSLISFIFCFSQFDCPRSTSPQSPCPGGPASGVSPAGSQQCTGAAPADGPRQRCGARRHPQGLGDQRGRLVGAIRWEGARERSSN